MFYSYQTLQNAAYGALATTHASPGKGDAQSLPSNPRVNSSTYDNVIPSQASNHQDLETVQNVESSWGSGNTW